MEKTLKGAKKTERVLKAFKHEEPDQIPVHDFFWTEFLKRWRIALGLPGDTDPYRYYDLDIVVQIPNLDPIIREFEILKQTDSETEVKTGFGAIIRKVHDFPMPHYAGFETDSIGKVEQMLCNAVTFEISIDKGRTTSLEFVGEKAYTTFTPDSKTSDKSLNFLGF